MAKTDLPVSLLPETSAAPGTRPARPSSGATPRLPEWARPKPDGAAPVVKGSSTFIVHRQHLVFAGVGVLLLVMMSFWIGSRIARHKADAEWQVRLDDVTRRMVGTVSGPSPAAGGAPVAAAGNSDSRVPGLNYVRLCTVPAGMGEQIAAFLMQNGVRPQLIPTQGGNDFILYAIDHGFKGEEINSSARNAYQTRLMDLGRTWSRSHGGRNPFAAPTLEKYDPAKQPK